MRVKCCRARMVAVEGSAVVVSRGVHDGLKEEGGGRCKDRGLHKHAPMPLNALFHPARVVHA